MAENKNIPGGNSAGGNQNPNAPKGGPEDVDYHDAKDAGKGEIFIYSLGGIIDELTTSGFRNLNQLLVIVFQVSPVLVGLLAAVKSIWDGIADPIVANWSDNCKNRFGRRRPFILTGGIIMSVIAWATWQFMPDNENLIPNEPVVPDVEVADSAWRSFGEMHLALGVDDYNIEVRAEDQTGGVIDPAALEQFGEDLVKQLGSRSKAIVRLASMAEAESTAEDAGEAPVAESPAGEDQEIPTYTLVFTALAANASIELKTEPTIEPPFEVTLEASLSGPGIAEPIVSQVEARTQAGKLTPYKRQKQFADWIVQLFTGAPEESGLVLDSTHADLTIDVLERRSGERALYSAQMVGMMEVLSQHLALPFERVLPESAEVAGDAVTAIRDKARQRALSEPDYLITLFVSNGLKVNPTDGLSAEEEAKIAEYRDQMGDTDNTVATWERMFDGLIIDEAASYHALIRDPGKEREIKTIWQKLGDGFSSFTDADPQTQKFLLFVGLAMVIMALGGTIYAAPYYAQGIEIAPSYNGRTLVVAYRGAMNSVIGIITQLFLPISLMPIFVDAREGSLALVYVLAPIGLCLAFLVFARTSERTVIVRDESKKHSFFNSIKEIGQIWDFWRILLLYVFMGYAIGSFNVLGQYLSIYYIFGGNLVMGASYQSAAGVLGIFTSLASIPLIVWLCKRIGKHNALRLALGSLALASIAKYFCYNPEIPALMFIPAFLYSPAIAAFYKILSTLMGDVTDLDELRNGERREGMFGAVMAIIMKTLGAFTFFAAGVVTVASGFEITKGVYQDPGVFHNMLLLFSVVPGLVSLLGFALLMNYKLTPERMAEIKEELAEARKQRAQNNRRLNT